MDKEQEQEKQIQNNKITSAVAFFVAIVSLFVAIWEGVESRAHNRLTVKPFLVLDRSINLTKNEDGTVIGQRCSLTLFNRGLGPAIIKSFKISHKGTFFENWPRAVKATGSTQELAFSSTFDADDVIDQDYESVLVEYKADEGKTKGITLTIEYESIYEELFTVSEICIK